MSGNQPSIILNHIPKPGVAALVLASSVPTIFSILDGGLASGGQDNTVDGGLHNTASFDNSVDGGTP